MGSQTRRVLLTPLVQPPRPFRVSNADRSSRRGVMASSLQELIAKALDVLVITAGLVTLVLEEDGTVVDTEEFFQTLGDNTHFMVLEDRQKWTPLSLRVERWQWTPEGGALADARRSLERMGAAVPHGPAVASRAPAGGQAGFAALSLLNGAGGEGVMPPPRVLRSRTVKWSRDLLHCGRGLSQGTLAPTLASKYAPARRPPRSGIAKVTLDLYRLHPKDFLGCLNVKATLYELYSVSYDIHCTGLKAMLRSLLRLLSYAAQVTGQFLVYAGSYALRLLDDTAPPSPKSQVGSWLGFLHR
ncbi:Cell death activator CIDE-A [Fukomys damarensis]|uniref:Lipid transferase CIDEA n=1 Tax=Fukomys damarensis TaxID=885580 RepID=A0A091D486_FUKDA|nr:Cell death activator CIDE-A [Fukomys damarensis]